MNYKAIFLCLLLGLSTFSSAQVSSYVAINGKMLSVNELTALQRRLGTLIAPGNYLVNAQGCWLNISTGARGCLGNSSAYNSRYGSGSRSANGSWNHWSNAAGGGVGGTSDGCIYTTYGWSNC